MTESMRRTIVGALVVLCGGSPALAQEPKSAALAAQLAAALDAAKLQHVATKDPSAEGSYIGALYFQGLQLIVVSGRYGVPILLDDRLSRSEYQEVYIELNGGSDPASRVFITDLGLNGLRVRPQRDQAPDSYETGGRRVMFDRNWRAQKLSEDDYMEIYAAADARYVELLTALLAQLKAGS